MSWRVYAISCLARQIFKQTDACPGPKIHSPDTRASLLLRLADRTDREAWDQFSQIYTPVAYRLALRSGLQHADAEDLAQQVLASVAKAIGRWEEDPTRARFRTWFHRVA